MMTLPIKDCNRMDSKGQEALNVPSEPETDCSKKFKPRALIFKACNKNFEEIKELIKTQFPEVKIIYVTSGPAASILRVNKSYLLKCRTLLCNHSILLNS